MEECVAQLEKVRDLLGQLDRILNPAGPPSSTKKKSFRVKESSSLRESGLSGGGSELNPSEALPLIETQEFAVDDNDERYTSFKVTRKLRDTKVTVDENTLKEQSEFGGDPIALLNVEREAPIGKEQLELGDYFSMRSDMRKNAGGFRPASVSSKDAVGLMLNKPSTAFARGQSGAFALKSGAAWSKVKAGVQGDISLPPRTPPESSGGDGGDGGGERPTSSGSVGSVSSSVVDSTTASSKPTGSGLKLRIPGVFSRGKQPKPSSAASSSTTTTLPAGGREEGGTSSASGRSRQVGVLRTSGAKTAGATAGRPRLRSISFKDEAGAEEEHARRQSNRGSDETQVKSSSSGSSRRNSNLSDNDNAGKPSTAPGNVGLSTTTNVIDQIHEAHMGLDKVMAEKDPSSVNMDDFRKAFHESGASQQQLEGKEKEKEKKKVAKKGGLLSGLTKGIGSVGMAASRRVSQMGAAAARAVTPDKNRKGKKYVVQAGMPDDVVLKDAIAYWTKVVDDGLKRKKRELKRAPSKDGLGVGIDSELNSDAAAATQNGSDAHNGMEWARLNLGLAKLCASGEGERGKEKESDALDALLQSQKDFPDDPTTYLRVGQTKCRSTNTSVKAAGLESLRTAHSLALRQEVKGDHGAFFVESSGSFGAAAYENSELKSAATCMDHVLRNGLFYATDEALCTKAQIMLRRGQLEDAQQLYKNFNDEKAVKLLVESEKAGDGRLIGGKLDEERKDGGRSEKKGGGSMYQYPQFAKTDMSLNLNWCKEARRSESLAAAGSAAA